MPNCPMREKLDWTVDSLPGLLFLPYKRSIRLSYSGNLLVTGFELTGKHPVQQLVLNYASHTNTHPVA